MKKFNIKVNGTSYEVEVEEEKVAGAAPAPKAAAPAAPKAAAPAAPAAPAKAAVSAGAGEASVNAPMPGKILSVHVRPGERVAAGDRLLVMEAMKMEHRIVAPFAATIAEIAVSDGGQVQEGSLLLKLEPEAG